MKKGFKSLTGLMLIGILLVSMITPTFASDSATGVQMILEYESKFDFEETIFELEKTIKSNKWSIVQVFDYKEILGQKGYDILNIRIFAVCSGKHSAAILQLDDERMVSPLMPCRISVYEKSDGKTYIALMNSSEVAGPFGGVIAETMKTVGSETKEMIKDLVVDMKEEILLTDYTHVNKDYAKYLAWFAQTEQIDGMKAYAFAIMFKENNGIALDDPEAAAMFKLDYPHYFMTQNLQMILEDESLYGFDETISQFEQAVKSNGWSVVGEFDYKEILGAKGYDILNIKIIAVCSGKYSAEILKLDNERMVSPLMPCTVAVYEKSNGKTYIARLNSGEVAIPFGGVISEVMQSVAQETEKMLSPLTK